MIKLMITVLVRYGGVYFRTKVGDVGVGCWVVEWRWSVLWEADVDEGSVLSVGFAEDICVFIHR
jgi:hypothetical protein